MSNQINVKIYKYIDLNAVSASGILQVKHGSTEQWRILQRPLQEGEDEAAAPMKTRLRRHTEQSVRERETRSSETKSAPTSPLDLVSPTGLSSHSKPAQWSVDQVWSFISSLPGENTWLFGGVPSDITSVVQGSDHLGLIC